MLKCSMRSMPLAQKRIGIMCVINFVQKARSHRNAMSLECVIHRSLIGCRRHVVSGLGSIPSLAIFQFRQSSLVIPFSSMTSSIRSFDIGMLSVMTSYRRVMIIPLHSTHSTSNSETEL